MSKPLSTHAGINLTTAPGVLVRHIVRMGLYWLCVTVLLWSSVHPLGAWRPASILYFMAVSSLVVPTLGYVSLLLRRQEGQAAYPSLLKPVPAVSHALSHTGTIATELLVVLLAAISVERLLF